MSQFLTPLDEALTSKCELDKSLYNFAQRKLSAHSMPTDEISIHALLRSRRELVNQVISDFKSNCYQLSPAKKVLYPGSKPRTGYSFSIIDQLVYFHFARVLERFISPLLPQNLHSFRPGFSNTRTLMETSEFIKLAKAPLYLSRRDVQGFGENLDLDLVDNDFKKWCNPGPIASALFSSLSRFPVLQDDESITSKLGLPTGTHLQLLMENLYLIDLDLEIERHKVFYRRFGDDILLLSTQEHVWTIARARIDATLLARKLTTNPEKSSDALLIRPHLTMPFATPRAISQFNYLGSTMRFDGSYTPTRAKIRKVRRFLRTRFSATLRNRGAVIGPEDKESRVKTLISSFVSILEGGQQHGHCPLTDYLRKTRDENLLRELDRWIAILVLSLASNKGFTKGRFRSKSYAMLRTQGLPSLLYLRRCGEL